MTEELSALDSVIIELESVFTVATSLDNKVIFVFFALIVSEYLKWLID
jgi:predicted DNA repair protein MutK